jgi:hypothetical protein
MSVIDQLVLDLPGLAAAPPPGLVLEGLSEQERAVVLGVLTRLMVKTMVPQLSVCAEGGDE